MWDAVGRNSGAEEDGFALEHFDGDEESDGCVYAIGSEDQCDQIPMIRACHEFLTQKAGSENGNERKFGGELDAGKHGGDGGNDDNESHGSEIALGFLVGFGEESDGHEDRGEKNGDRKSHEEDGDDGLGAEVKEEARGSVAAAR